MSWIVHCADVLDWCERYEGPKFHACLCDPPYELAFMGKKWDASGVAFQPATWAAIAEHLHPGGFILAFGGSRTYHRLAVAAEDAGLIIHPALVWLNGQGFPKATRIGKNGNHPEFEGHRYSLQALKPCAEFILVAQKPYAGRPVDCITRTGAGALNIDQSRVATGDTLAAHNGTGRGVAMHGNEQENWPNPYKSGDNGKYVNTQGRWPPNCVLSHVPSRPDGAGGWLPGCERLGVKRVGNGQPKRATRPRGDAWRKLEGRDDRLGQVEALDSYGEEDVTAWACVLACACGHEWTAEQRGPCPECGGEARWICPVGELGEQSGERITGIRKHEYKRAGGWKNTSEYIAAGGYTDTGTAARFFPQFSWSYEAADRLAQVPPYRYVSKAARAERDAGLEGLPERTKRILNGGIPSAVNSDPRGMSGGGDRKARNHHPCVKPLELLIWLATLILPPPEYAPRRIIIPFGGVMSEAIGAGLAGWDEIEAIEKEEEYIPIGEARLAHWLKQIRMELVL